MRKILKNIASLILVSIMAFFTLTSCGTKLAELFKMETFNYSYEKLSDGLLRIEYVNVTKWYEEDGPKYEHKVYKTLSAEEQERVLREMNDIEFKETFSTNFKEVKGEALVFCYTEYKLYISPGAIEKNFEEGYTNENGEILVYSIKRNENFVNLMESVKDK